MSLGFDKPTLEPKETRLKKAPATKKRSLPETSADADDDGGNKPPAKAQRVESDSTSGIRRSSRNAGKTVDYRNEVVKGSPVPISFSSGVKTSDNSGPLGRQTGQRKYDPLAFLFLHQHFHY
jgi:E3 ubiquitin-protein ligase UHRF1